MFSPVKMARLLMFVGAIGTAIGDFQASRLANVLGIGHPQNVRNLENEVLQFEQTEVEGAKPAFCNNLDCPLFKVIEKHADYELREYEDILWVQTRKTGMDYRDAMSDNFQRLFEYITGANAKKQKIAMTVPVINRIIPGQGPACESDFTMSFYLSQNTADFTHFPAPTNPKVKLMRMPKFRAFVRSFPGYAMSFEPYRLQAEKMAEAIGDTSRYYTDHYYTVGYNSPFEFFNRHNEVWFIAK